ETDPVTAGRSTESTEGRLRGGDARCRVVASGQSQVRDDKRKTEQAGGERAELPEPYGDRKLRAGEEDAERVHRDRQQAGGDGCNDSAAGRPIDGADEEVERECAREREQRVHPSERRVDGQQLRR